ncbi:MAG TPA: hypothetical protein VGO50_13810 [Pyrinomonadaceae bacterium]|jgi:hypothetical protein|nr:hypothetical protein [Pyrinomonadaceae bacterium]
MRSLTVPVKITTLLSILFFINLAAPSQTPQTAQTPQLKPAGDSSPYILPAGTVIRVKMDNGITSRSASVNDTFTTTVATPVFIRSVEVIPAGTVIEGRVVKVGHAKRGGGAGFINISFETLKLRDGTTRKITGELGAGEENDPADIDTGDIDGSEGSPTTSVGFIAGGAGAGVLVGGLTKGGSGAAIGGVLGAGAGALASYLRKGEEATIATNAQLAVVLRQSVTLPAQDF